MKKLAILQSNYLPWRGYFDLIAAVDEFIVYDEAQYTKNDWRNRNLIKAPQGLQWLTVPVKSSGLLSQTVRSAEIAGTAWAVKHWKSLEANYRRARHFDEVAALLRPVYLEHEHRLLSDLNRELIDLVCRYVGIGTRITDDCDYLLAGDRTERLVSLCEQAGATLYLSGPAARSYLDEQRFAARGVGVQWFDYDGYADYPQLWGAFSPRVSVLDLMFNCGRQSAHYLRYARR
jgi:hypothetical protein